MVQPKPVSKTVETGETGFRAPVHAEALLRWLEDHYRQHIHCPNGLLVGAGEVKGAYPKMLEEQGWEALPWDGRKGVGKHLAALTGGKQNAYFPNEYGGKTYGRAYLIYPLGKPSKPMSVGGRKRKVSKSGGARVIFPQGGGLPEQPCALAAQSRSSLES